MTKKNSELFSWNSVNPRISQTAKVLSVKKNDINLTRIPIPIIFYVSLGLCIFTSVLVFIIQNSLPPEIPLFYGLAEGPEQLSTSLGLLIPSVLSMFIILFNVFLSLLLKNDFLKKTLIIAGFAMAVFSTITTVKIMLLIGSF